MDCYRYVTADQSSGVSHNRRTNLIYCQYKPAMPELSMHERSDVTWSVYRRNTRTMVIISKERRLKSVTRHKRKYSLVGGGDVHYIKSM